METIDVVLFLSHSLCLQSYALSSNPHIEQKRGHFVRPKNDGSYYKFCIQVKRMDATHTFIVNIPKLHGLQVGYSGNFLSASRAARF